MKLIIYGFIIFYSFLELWINPKIVQLDIATNKLVFLFLIIVIVLLLKEKFYNNNIFAILTYLIISILVLINHYFYGLIAIIAFDSMYKNIYKYAFIFMAIPIYFLIQYEYLNLIYLLPLTILIGYIMNQKQTQQKFYILALDNERRIRYELESTKLQLMQNSKEIERLTEIKERNRIARELHDNIGHDIAGVLFQLQAAEKIYEKDSNKTLNIIRLCNNRLIETLNLIRNTVYNIKPNQEINESIFKKVINQFLFCPIDFKINGNINNLSPELIEILLTNLKESLTNSSKYSGASNIDIKIEITKNYIRYYYKDNGKGCLNIKEGLGISGIKDRVKNLGGIVNIDGSNGFSIVCVVPITNTKIFNHE